MTVSTPSIELEIGSDALFWICFAMAAIGYIVVGCIVSGLLKRFGRSVPDADRTMLGILWPILLVGGTALGLFLIALPVFDFLFGWIYRIAAGEGKEGTQ